MSVQLSYDIDQAKAYAGLIYAQAPHDIISRAIETVAGAAFGLAVSRGTDKDKEAIIGGATGFLGITVRALDSEGAANTGALQYNQFESAAILRDGYLWVVCPSGCNPGDPANFVEATGVIDAGAPVGVGETGMDGATWETTAAAGELAVLRLNSTLTTAGV